MKTILSLSLHLLAAGALLLPVSLAAQQKQAAKIFEVTVKRTDGRKSRGVPVVLADSAIRILRKKPVSPVAFLILGMAGTAVGRYRDYPDTITIPVAEIEKISAGRRSAKWITVSATTILLSTAGALIGLRAIVYDPPSYVRTLAALTMGASIGQVVGIPLGVALANGTRKRFILNGSLEEYQKARAAMTRYLPED